MKWSNAVALGGLSRGSGGRKPLAEEQVRRAEDFSDTGNYEIMLRGKIYRFYRDPESKYWYEDASGHFTLHFLGFTKDEAIAKLAEKYYR